MAGDIKSRDAITVVSGGPILQAELLPMEGPTYAEMVDSRLKFLGRERVMSVALSVARLVFDPTVIDQMVIALNSIKYMKLHEGTNFDARFNIGPMVDQISNTLLMHQVLGNVSMLDAERRGVPNPRIGFWETWGGRMVFNNISGRPHIDDPENKNTVFRYAFTAIGRNTGFSREETCLDDFSEGLLNRDILGEGGIEFATAGSIVDVSLFLEHTTHFRPPADGLARLFSTDDVFSMQY